MLFAKSCSLVVASLAATLLASGATYRISAAKADDAIAQGQTEPAAESPAATETPATDQVAPEPAAGNAPAAPAEEGETAAPPAAQDAPAENAETPAEPSDTEGSAKSNEGNHATDSDKQASPPAEGSTDVAPVAPEAPAAPPNTAADSDAQGTAVDASQLKIGTPVFGSDGEKIGEINGVKSGTDGKVQEILVTDGVAAGINAKAFAVPGDKIANTAGGVKLSLSSQDAKKLPIVDNGNG